MLPFLLLALLATAVGCSQKVRHTRTAQQTITPANLESIDLSTFNGAVKVGAHAGDTIDLEITYRAYGATAEEAKANCELLGCDVSFERGKFVATANKPKTLKNASAEFAVKMPRHCRLAIETSNGQVKVNEINAEVDIETSNGSVTCRQIHGALVVGKPATVPFRSVTGTVAFSCRPRTDRSLMKVVWLAKETRSKTNNGAVEVSLPAGQPVELFGKTSNGTVSCQLEGAEVTKEERNQLQAVVAGDNSVKIDVETSNGSVQFVTWKDSPPVEEPAETEQPSEPEPKPELGV